MQMSPKKNFLDNVWVMMFYLGMIFVPSISISPFTKLSLKSQSALALLSSFCWIASSFLFTRIPTKLEISKNYQLRFLAAGIVQAVLAVLFQTLLKPRTEVASWTAYFNFIFGFISFLIFYIVLVFYIFPSLSKKISNIESDPLSKSPSRIREIINNGRKWINGSIGFTVALFFVIGVVGNFVADHKYNNNSGNFFFICTALGFGIAFTLGIVLTYKWQAYARKSGISEKELKSAANLAGLWWPKTKKQK
jgi:hypothetical protein